jgi:hypothetical protein
MFYLPSTRRIKMDDLAILPAATDRSVAGWLYFNVGLDNGALLSAPRSTASQSWITVSMEAEGRYAVGFYAAMLGNGCTEPTPFTDEDGGPPTIEPAPNDTPDYGSTP